MNILIADDESVVRLGIRTIIQRSGEEWFVVGEASDGNDAIEKIEKYLPDVAIIDIKMPGIDGIELTRIVSQRFPDILVIIISGYSEFSFAQKLIGTNAIGYILKPTSPEKLINILKSAQTILNKNRERKMKEKILIDELAELRKKVEDTIHGRKSILDINNNAGMNAHELRKIIELAISYIKRNYDKDIKLMDVANAVNLSKSYFCNLFRKNTGMPFSDFLAKVRIDNAKNLIIQDPSICVYEVANKVGYKDPKYFSIVFRKYEGLTPTEFREKSN